MVWDKTSTLWLSRREVRAYGHPSLEPAVYCFFSILCLLDDLALLPDKPAGDGSSSLEPAAYCFFSILCLLVNLSLPPDKPAGGVSIQI